MVINIRIAKTHVKFDMKVCLCSYYIQCSGLYRPEWVSFLLLKSTQSLDILVVFADYSASLEVFPSSVPVAQFTQVQPN